MIEILLSNCNLGEYGVLSSTIFVSDISYKLNKEIASLVVEI